MMAANLHPRRKAALIGAGVAIAVGVVVAMDVFQSGTSPRVSAPQQLFGTIRPDGKLVLRVMAPKLY
ncbi:hypothetical protein ASE49_00890 [Novosphingobium sp. Leaf2]|nr:hypothetical protein ASE49_00890 [Novosphingobium sp. Leaf2]